MRARFEPADTVTILPSRPAPAAAPAVPAAGTGWHPRWLMAAPHRIGFFAGALMLALSALWWAVGLALRHGFDVPLRWALSPGLAHSLWFGFGFMPLFFAGFLFTSVPKWLRLPPVPARALRLPLLVAISGWGVFVVGAHVARPMAAAGLLAVAFGWLLLTGRLVALVHGGRSQDRLHPTLIAIAWVVGLLALGAAAAALLRGRDDIARVAVQLGLWGFVGVVYVTAAHRMVAFFSASAL